MMDPTFYETKGITLEDTGFAKGQICEVRFANLTTTNFTGRIVDSNRFGIMFDKGFIFWSQIRSIYRR
jgi:hypothetical protein